MLSLAKPQLCNRCVDSVRKIFPSEVALWSRRLYTTEQQHGKGPFRMAVIGSGPAGFYTAYKVMSRIENAVVDMYEQLPVPYGLVRYGVAPDHPEVKNCQDKFEEVAASSNFNFIGNVAIGHDPNGLTLKSLLPHYNAVLYAYGASKDRSLGIPGENALSGIYSARAFVGWYNGLPEYSELAPDLTQGEEATVIGQGNVALDVARILLQDPDILKTTDITSNAIETLRRSRIKRVRVVGRRGPLQAAFTIKEIRELVKLQSVGFEPIDGNLLPQDISKLPRAPRRIAEVLKKGSTISASVAPKKWSLDFCLSPLSFNSRSTSLSQLNSVSFEKTRLDPTPLEPMARAVGTGETIDVSSAVAFRSIGYKSEALPGFSELGIPFDNRLGIIPNDPGGRVMNPDVSSDSGAPRHIPGMYCAGWVKRGPTGVIASTMQDAFSTAEAIAEDWYANSEFINAGSCDGWESLKHQAEKVGCRRVSWQDWQKINVVEQSQGQSKGKEREKFTRIEDMLAVLD